MPAPLPEVRYAFVGLRACDLAAIEIQDRVFLIADPAYRARREQAVFIGVNCGAPGETCFCVSMGTGRAARPGSTSHSRSSTTGSPSKSAPRPAPSSSTNSMR